MATYHKNIAIGLTMLIGLVLLGTMILLFGDAPIKLFSGAQMNVTFVADSGEGLSKGSPVFYRGVYVGKVDDVVLAGDRESVEIKASLETNQNIPANVEGVVRGNPIGGTSTLSLELVDPTPQGTISHNARIKAHMAGSGILPKEFTDLAKDIRALVVQITEGKLVERLGGAMDSANKTFVKVGDAVDELRKIVGDEKLRADIRDTLANFRTVSENAKTIAKNLETFSGKLNKLSGDAERVMYDVSATVNKAGARIDELSKALAQRMDQVGGVLERMQSIAHKIDKGDGTAGKLINDAKLYEALTDTTAELHLTIRSLHRLVQQWEQEGVPFKLGK